MKRFSCFLCIACLLLSSIMVHATACSAAEPAAVGNGQTSPDVPAENMTGESTKEMAETVTVSGAETESANENSIKTVTVYYPDSVSALGDAVSYINEPESLHELFDYSDMDGAYSLEEAAVTYMGHMPYGNEPLYTYLVSPYCYINEEGYEIEPDGYVFPNDEMAQTLSDLGLVVITGYAGMDVYDPENNPLSRRYLVAAPEGLVGEIFQDGGDPIAHWMFRVMPIPLE